ncbi:maleylpyruvate isomerase family mycothiol-dependent enzyme [Nocardia sp. CDC160]|uniref:maleylpyruvate isomerase family mycothiol-dependent enzyme n=1 Tax=Nocardia sp. CDC160 TaxID=3112166 RepID=UPI002DBF9288|nr:maleylpyruvate isomerase family mycothiol-dependent enzyme [Nocardia sp. CDC160]MEC3915534.1 maleylpyruvate isomerase family mycothiol-dependent enzyme [Nocardia sp. CDC160]
MVHLDLELQAEGLVGETDRLADVVRDVDLSVPVPTCPGWSLSDLIVHVGRGHRWAAAMIADRASERLAWDAVPEGFLPTDVDEANVWLRDSARLVLEAVEKTGGEVRVWTPVGGLLPARWWIRRRLHEATVHGADAALALGRAVSLSSGLAADGLSESLDILQAALAFQNREQPPLPEGATLRIDADDDGAQQCWVVRPRGNNIEWSVGGEPAAATVTVRGTSASVFLAMMRRIPATDPRFEITGDREIFDRWLAATGF